MLHTFYTVRPINLDVTRYDHVLSKTKRAQTQPVVCSTHDPQIFAWSHSKSAFQLVKALSYRKKKFFLDPTLLVTLDTAKISSKVCFLIFHLCITQAAILPSIVFMKTKLRHLFKFLLWMIKRFFPPSGLDPWNQLRLMALTKSL